MKAKTATIHYAGIDFEGLMLPNGDYAISVSQTCRIFSFPTKHGSRSLKALLGKGFSFPKTASELNSKPVNILSLTDFSKVALLLALKGNNEKARAIVEASIELPIKMSYDKAFDQRVSSEQNLRWFNARVAGKAVRRTLTDAIDYYLENTANLSDNYRKFIYSNVSNKVNLIVFNRTSKRLKKDWGCNMVRDNMTSRELDLVRQVEDLAMRLIDHQGYEPMKAVDEAGVRLVINFVDR